MQRLGGKARRFDAPGADHLNASVARLPRHTDAPPASAVDYKMIERDATDVQVAVAGQAEFAAHALHSVNLKSAIAPHHDTADGGCGQVKRHAPRIPLFLSRSEEHTSELPSLMRNSYAVSCCENK